MLLKDLQTLGFTKNLSTIYLVLFELGEAKAGEIVRKTGMHRNIVYRGLEELEEKKLITKSQVRGIALFKVLDPARIMGEVENKQKLAEQIIEELKEKHSIVSQEIIVREGVEELRKFEMDTYNKMEKGEVLCHLGLSTNWYEVLGKKVTEKLVNIQNQKQFFIHAISGYITGEEKGYEQVTKGLTTFKTISSITARKNEVTICRDKVFIKIFIEPYTIIEIKNHEIVASYKEYFNLLWNQEVTTYSGWEEVENLFFNYILPSQHTGDTEYNMGAGYREDGSDARVVDFYLRYNSQRTKRGITKKIIFFEGYREDSIKEFTDAGDEKFEFVEMRYVPDQYYSAMQTHITKDKVIIMMWSDNPVATVYEDPKVVASFKKQFDQQWDTAKE